MPRRVSGRHVKASRSYTILEAAERLRVSVGTVREWVRSGLPIMKAKRPYLISGTEIRHFLEQRTGKRRASLAADQLYCLACKGPRRPLGSMVDCIPQTAKTARLFGLCEVCNAPCHRIVSRASLPAFQEVFAVEMRELRAA